MKTREIKDLIHGFPSKHPAAFTQLILQPILMNPGFNYASPLHATMGPCRCGFFLSLCCSHHRSAPAQHFQLVPLLLVLCSPCHHFVKLIPCREAAHQPGQVPNSPQAHSHYVLSDCANSTAAATARKNKATLLPAVLVLARLLVLFCFSIYTQPAYSYGDTMHGVGTKYAGWPISSQVYGDRIHGHIFPISSNCIHYLL